MPPYLQRELAMGSPISHVPAAGVWDSTGIGRGFLSANEELAPSMRQASSRCPLPSESNRCGRFDEHAIRIVESETVSTRSNRNIDRQFWKAFRQEVDA